MKQLKKQFIFLKKHVNWWGALFLFILFNLSILFEKISIGTIITINIVLSLCIMLIIVQIYIERYKNYSDKYDK